MREDPEAAYEPEFLGRLQATGYFGEAVAAMSDSELLSNTPDP